MIKKKLIEVAIPIEIINKAAIKEKSIRQGHPSTLHLWWARRPLAICRAVLFAQLVDDPSNYPDDFPTLKSQKIERDRLFKIIEELVQWKNTNNLEILEKAKNEIKRCCDDEIPSIYDPFSGGGSIPLEAQRIGLKSFGSDLNPVAVIIGKSMIEMPVQFKNMFPVHPGIKEKTYYRNTDGLSEDIIYFAKELSEMVYLKIGHLYPKLNLDKKNNNQETIMAWIWARTINCPNPAFKDEKIPLVSTYWLSKKPKKMAWVEPEIINQKVLFKVKSGKPQNTKIIDNGNKSGRGANFICPLSSDAITADYVKKEGMAGRLGWQLLAIVTEGKGDRLYRSASIEHNKLAFSEISKWEPEFPMSKHPQYMSVTNYGTSDWSDMFMPRQKIALNTFLECIPIVINKINASAEYKKLIMTYLVLCVSRLANRQSTSSFWNTTSGMIEQVFAMQALPMRWDTAEGNPFSSSSGNFIGQAKYLAKAVENLPSANVQGSLKQKNASSVNYNNCVISTDPPYYDNVPYADLSDFFYVWLRQGLRKIYPELFETMLVPKDEELVADTHRHNGKEKADKFFLTGMTKVMSKMANESNSNFPATIYYAFRQGEVDKTGVSSKGWATFIQAIIDAGFTINATWPMRTEDTGKLKKIKNVLATSVVMSCRKREEDLGTITRAEFIRQLKTELPKAISDLKAANISPADIPQSSIGPGIGIFSRYKAVLENDDSHMSVKTALQLINRELGDEEGEYDSETSFAITWFEQNGFNVGDFGSANNIANAKGISVNTLVHSGVAQSSGGKFSLLDRESLEDDWDPTTDKNLTIWECCQYLIKTIENKGEFETAKLMKQMGFRRADSAKELAYTLYDIAANKRKDANEATAYNGLIAVWSELTAQSVNITEGDLRGDAQMKMI